MPELRAQLSRRCRTEPVSSGKSKSRYGAFVGPPAKLWTLYKCSPARRARMISCCQELRGPTMERKKASDFPQELLNLFDRYVHGDIDRRAFLDDAKRFAVGGMTAMGLFEALRPNYAWAEQVPKDDSRI